MARSKVRKGTKEKLKRERAAAQAETSHQNRIADLAITILKDNPPHQADPLMSTDQIESWFDSDPEAPLVALLPGPPQAHGPQLVQASVNARAIERELRKHGIDASHPDWEDAFHLTRHMAMEAVKNFA